MGLVPGTRLLRLQRASGPTNTGVHHCFQTPDLNKTQPMERCKWLAPSSHQQSQLQLVLSFQALDLEDNALAEWSKVARLAPLTALTRLQLGGNRLASVSCTLAAPGARGADGWHKQSRALHSSCLAQQLRHYGHQLQDLLM